MSFKMLDAVTTTGASQSVPIRKIGVKHTVQATTTGNPTAVTVDLEGSLDNITWFQIATSPFTAGEITAQGSMFHVIDTPVRYVRVNLTTLLGGTSPTVTVLYEPEEHKS
jgi:hypothetical protein